jgi:nucleotide-binding universal stress UspA family protein
MGCYRTILVALDGSRDADAALRHAATLARDQHACLVLLSVIPPPPPQMVSVAGAMPPADLESFYCKLLRGAADALPQDVGVETRIAHGVPARHILKTALETHADLIVMGFHGHGRLHHALLGSVSRTVLNDGRLPVLLMHAGPKDRAPDDEAPVPPVRASASGG